MEKAEVHRRPYNTDSKEGKGNMKRKYLARHPVGGMNVLVGDKKKTG